MKKRSLFLGILLLVGIFIFQACDLPTEPENNGKICQADHYDIEIVYERTEEPIWDNDAVIIYTSWKSGCAYMEKIGPDRYKILLKNVPVNRPKGLARFSQPMAILIRDKKLWEGYEDPMQRTCVVVEKVYARVPGKTGKVELIRNQDAELCEDTSGVKEILINLHCDGRIS